MTSLLYIFSITCAVLGFVCGTYARTFTYFGDNYSVAKLNFHRLTKILAYVGSRVLYFNAVIILILAMTQKDREREEYLATLPCNILDYVYESPESIDDAAIKAARKDIVDNVGEEWENAEYIGSIFVYGKKDGKMRSCRLYYSRINEDGIKEYTWSIACPLKKYKDGHVEGFLEHAMWVVTKETDILDIEHFMKDVGRSSFETRMSDVKLE